MQENMHKLCGFALVLNLDNGINGYFTVFHLTVNRLSSYPQPWQTAVISPPRLHVCYLFIQQNSWMRQNVVRNTLPSPVISVQLATFPLLSSTGD